MNGLNDPHLNDPRMNAQGGFNANANMNGANGEWSDYNGFKGELGS